MLLRCICFIVLALGAASAASKQVRLEKLQKGSIIDGDRVAALYVKDNENGELRFLASNAALSNYITQTQNLLEQLRPAATGIAGTAGTAGTTGTLGTLSSLLGTTNNGGVRPIIVSLGNGGGGGGGNNNGAALANIPSPISSLLPQVIAQAVVGQNQNRRGINRRRNNKRRRPGQRQVFVIRPSRG